MMRGAAGCQKDTAPVWTAVLAALENIQHQQQRLADAIQLQQDTLSASQQAFASQQQHLALAQERMLQRIIQLERRGQDDDQDHHHLEVSSELTNWVCPFCSKVLTHRHSFKGHIRRLVKQSSRPKCHLNPRDVSHLCLVHRFPGHDFYTQANNFCAAFYAFVARAISKARADDISRRLVNAWLESARARDGRPFPTCSYSSGPESDQGLFGISSDSSHWSSSGAL
jgi:hypothetical protein